MYGPIGYYIDCDTALCDVHADIENWEGFEDWTEPAPIFADTEGDTPTHCDSCGELIAHDLTDYGVNYVVEALTDVKGIFSTPREDRGDPTAMAWEDMATPPLNAGVLEQWADRLEELGYLHPANVGRGLIALASEPLAPNDGPTPYRLARIADVGSPDSPTSPGAEYLAQVFDDIVETAQHEPDSMWADDVAAEIAERVTPVYTSEIWAIYVDLAAWGEDLDGMIDPAEGVNMENLARLALYQIAARLALLFLEGDA